MAIFVMGDLHLSLDGEKSMSVFPGWQNYHQHIEENWRNVVSPEDTVVLAGDTSWAMKLEDTVQDFSFLESLPGKKLLLKGNHDYWWSTAKKMEDFFAAQEFHSLQLLFNNAHCVEGVWLCGTRSWMFAPDEPQDQKVMAREEGRLRLSLKAAGEGEKIAFLHYPPVWATGQATDILALLNEHHVKRCFYGHLHGGSIRNAVQGMHEGIEYRLISADSLQFCPYKIAFSPSNLDVDMV